MQHLYQCDHKCICSPDWCWNRAAVIIWSKYTRTCSEPWVFDSKFRSENVVFYREHHWNIEVSSLIKITLCTNNLRRLLPIRVRIEFVWCVSKHTNCSPVCGSEKCSTIAVKFQRLAVPSPAKVEFSSTAAALGEQSTFPCVFLEFGV